MWEYKKRLEYPVKIKNPNPALAKVIISQLGGAGCICYNVVLNIYCKMDGTSYVFGHYKWIKAA